MYRIVILNVFGDGSQSLRRGEGWVPDLETRFRQALTDKPVQEVAKTGGAIVGAGIGFFIVGPLGASFGAIAAASLWAYWNRRKILPNKREHSVNKEIFDEAFKENEWDC